MGFNRFNYQRNNTLKVFSKLYVASKFQGEDRVPLAFVTPYEDTAAGKKRQQTADSWARGYYAQKVPNFESRVVENTPRSGWKITDDVRRVYWGGGNVVWRVEDPLGYELEISSGNLMALIQTCGIDAGGEIPGKCLLARDGAVNVLLHESSDEFKNVVLEAETLSTSKAVSKADREVGARYIMKNGDTVIYLGTVYARLSTYDYESLSVACTFTLPSGKRVSNYHNREITWDFSKDQKYELVQLVELEGTNEVTMYRKAQLVKKLPGSYPAVEVTNEWLAKQEFKLAGSSSIIDRVFSVTREPFSNPHVVLQPLSDSKFENLVSRLSKSSPFEQNWVVFTLLERGKTAVNLCGITCGGVELVQDGDKYYLVGTELVIRDGKFTVTDLHTQLRNSLTSYGNRMYSTNTHFAPLSTARTAVIPTGFRSTQELLTFVHRLREQGDLLEITISDDQGSWGYEHRL